ncbi:hypothetical protein DSECCO2_361230 [anaerobic digester metagenome]
MAFIDAKGMAQAVALAAQVVALDHLVGDSGAFQGSLLVHHPFHLLLLHLDDPDAVLVHLAFMLDITNLHDAVQRPGVQIEAYTLELALLALRQRTQVDEVTIYLGLPLTDYCDHQTNLPD